MPSQCGTTAALRRHMGVLAASAVLGGAMALALPTFAAALVPLDASAPAARQPAAGTARVKIELRPHVSVRQPTVTLGDIAFLTTGDLALLRRLMAVPLGSAPRPGAAATLDRDLLGTWILARAGEIAPSSGTAGGASAIEWSGPWETQIETATQELSGEEIASAARAALLDWLATRSVRADVQAVSVVRDLLLPAGTPALRVRPLTGHVQPDRRMQVWIEAWVDGRFVRTMAVNFEVSAWTSLPVALGALERGAVLDPVVRGGAFATKEVDIAQVGRRVAAPLSDAAATGDQRLRRPLRPGEVLTQAHLEPAPDVARGQSARMDVRSGEIWVQSRVEILQDGKTGELVRVKTPAGSSPVLARVTGPGQVEVQP